MKQKRFTQLLLMSLIGIKVRTVLLLPSMLQISMKQVQRRLVSRITHLIFQREPLQHAPSLKIPLPALSCYRCGHPPLRTVSVARMPSFSIDSTTTVAHSSGPPSVDGQIGYSSVS